MNMRTASVMVSALIMALILYLLYLFAVQGFVQYHWDVRMDHITLYFGDEPVDPFALDISYLLLVAFTAVCLIAAIEVFWNLDWSIRTILITFTAFAAYLFLINPPALTYILVIPLLFLHMIVLLVGGTVTFIVKYAVVVGAMIIFSLLYRAVR